MSHQRNVRRKEHDGLVRHSNETRESPQGSYSQGWRAGDFIFVSGTGLVDPLTGKIVGETIRRQTQKTIDNIAAILEADGASLTDVVKVTVHLSDPSLFSLYDAVYPRRFSPPRRRNSGRDKKIHIDSIFVLEIEQRCNGFSDNGGPAF